MSPLLSGLCPLWRGARMLLLGCVALGVFPAPAAEPEPADYVVDTWQTDAGLPHNSVTAVLQASDGYLWVGTSNGLARFDGARFTIFRAIDSPGLNSNRLLCLYEEPQGFLWAGTDGGGLARYQNGEFRSWTSSDGLSSDTVLCVGQDKAGELWAGSASGLNRRTAGGPGNFLEVDGQAGVKTHAVCQLRGGPLLFATEKGLFRIHAERFGGFEPPGWPPLKCELFCVYQDRGGMLWVGGETGLFCGPLQNVTSATGPAKVFSATVRALAETPAGEIWFGTEQGELYRLASAQEVTPVLVGRFPGAVSALCSDREGNVWVGTANGLHRLKPRQLRWLPFPGGITEARVACIFDTAEGERWLVAGDQGLYRCHHGRFTLLERLPLPDGVLVQAACAGRNGGLWFGTLGDGLFEYRNGTLNQFSERDGLSDSAIKVMCADEEGLWLGTRNGGLNYLKDGAVTRFHTPWGFTGNSASALVLDSQGDLWVGTSGDGLYRLAHGQFTAYGQAEGLPSDYVYALCAETDGVLWVGTAKGLARVKAGRVTSFANGLNPEPILQLRQDAEGNLWVGSSGGLARIRKEQLNAFADGRTRWLDVVPYGREDGLPGIQCVPAIYSQSWRGGEPGVWFFTTKGLVEAQPGLAWNPSPPPVVLESIWAENQSVPLSGRVRIAPGKESLRFQFAALSLTAPGKVLFRYQLEGVDRDWSEPNASHTARYPKVPPGQYRFRVLACNNDGVWNEQGAGAVIVVAPFWWETAWFKAALGAALAGSLLFLYRLRLARRREIERLRLRIAGDLHDDVGSSLWSITLLSRMLARQGALGPEERQDVEEIHRIAVQTSNSIRDIIWLINPAFDTLQDLVSRLKDFAGTALRGSAFKLHCDGADLTRRLPLDFRQHLFFFLKEALANVARHAQAAAVEVRLAESAGRWRFSIQDNGVGFDSTSPTHGNGLKNLRSRAAKLGATLEVQSRPGQGTTIVLTTPKL